MRETHTQRQVRLHAEVVREKALAHPAVREAIAAAREEGRVEERAACAEIVDGFIAAYPERFFPEPPAGQHGRTIDACSARALRGVLPNVAAAIRARGEEAAGA